MKIIFKQRSKWMKKIKMEINTNVGFYNGKYEFKDGSIQVHSNFRSQLQNHKMTTKIMISESPKNKKTEKNVNMKTESYEN